MSVVRRFWVPVLGLLMFLTGVVVTFVLPEINVGGVGEALVGTPGYFSVDFTHVILFTTPSAGLLIVVGAILVAGWVGYRLGNRKVSKSGEAPLDGA